MKQRRNRISFFDENLKAEEQLPRNFTLAFKEVGKREKAEVRVFLNNDPVGDIINDNSYKSDNYRYHDVFHYTFAALLGWSPCTRSMMRRKRKSDKTIDEIEDGARATITEEAISMIVFNEAKRKSYFQDHTRVSRTTLRIIKEMTDNFEVRIRKAKEWEFAILKAYEIFRQLVLNKGGIVNFDALERQVSYSNLK